MAFRSDMALGYLRIRILLLLLLVGVAGVSALLSPVLGDGDALLVGFAIAVVGVFVLFAAQAVRR